MAMAMSAGAWSCGRLAKGPDPRLSAKSPALADAPRSANHKPRFRRPGETQGLAIALFHSFILLLEILNLCTAGCINQALQEQDRDCEIEPNTVIMVQRVCLTILQAVGFDATDIALAGITSSPLGDKRPLPSQDQRSF